jgi:hypothetical protein
MPKNIRNLGLFSRLYNLLQTERSELNSTPPRLGEILHPVIDVHKFNQKTQFDTSLSTATSGTHTYTVPTGKAWTLLGADSNRANAGSIGLLVGSDIDVENISVTLKEELNVTTAQFSDFTPIRLTERMRVMIYYGTGTSGTLQDWIVYLEEDV